jgi:hypothetical protein
MQSLLTQNPKALLTPFSVLRSPSLTPFSVPDQAFDRGLISFADDGEILISSCLSAETCSLLGIGKELRVAPVHQANRPFLAFHRERHGFGV